MPRDSLYYPVRNYIDKAARPSWTFMPAPIFASKLVSKLLRKKKPAMVYLGTGLWFAYLCYFVAWCASWFVGVKFWDMALGRPFGMVELKRIVEEREGGEKVKEG
jgi:1-acylglycerone phosphate reductase